MELSEIAKVAVAAAPYSIDKPYDYLVPAPLASKAQVGTRVMVPFGRGNRSSEGIVLARSSARREKGLKELSAVLDDQPVLGEQGIALALFLRQRYFCTLFEAVKTILPAGLWYALREVCHLSSPGLDRPGAQALAGRTRGAEAVLDALFAAGGEGEVSALKSACGPGTEDTLRALSKKGVITLESRTLRRLGDKQKRMAELSVDAETALAEAERKQRSAPVRSEVLRLLSVTGRASASDLCYFTGATSQTLRGLEKAGFLTFSQEEELRVPTPETVTPGAPIVLNGEQQRSFDRLAELTRRGEPAVALLEGVTGSGKTEVYLRLVQEVLAQGRTAMVLVPEIVLTPQMMRRFAACFGTRVVMLHSALRLTERYDQWKRIRRGEVDVVLGTRSAVFAPLENLGLIVLDEEQESSYQSETPPRYHTRDVAKFRCTQSGALLVLGSATPAVESAWYARQGIYHRECLTGRYNRRPLPTVVLADLRREIRRGNAGSLSQSLQEELERNLERGEQSILFLNRRGSSRMLLCIECGDVPTCPRCSVPLTYHSANGRLMCHYCGHSERASETCPVCGGYRKHVGTGTQKVEEELRDRFPGVGVLRLDADTASGGHEAILKRFETEKIPILLGTQMVTKGLDFQNVTLVGVLSADLSLYVDNYRAAERTFSLLTQAVGRAGRGEKPGRAVLQTYTPENEVLQAAARQDYERFYESEIRLRRARRDPPFADQFTLTVTGADESRVLQSAAWLCRELCRRCKALPEGAPEILGPAPAPVVRVNNRYRYRCVLVGKNDLPTRSCVAQTLKAFSADGSHRGLGIYADCNAME